MSRERKGSTHSAGGAAQHRGFARPGCPPGLVGGQGADQQGVTQAQSAQTTNSAGGYQESRNPESTGPRDIPTLKPTM